MPHDHPHPQHVGPTGTRAVGTRSTRPNERRRDMPQCEMCEGAKVVRAVNPRSGKREDTMPKETCPNCGGTGEEPKAEEVPAPAPEPEADEGESDENASV